jgi:hypothetical protein
LSSKTFSKWFTFYKICFLRPFKNWMKRLQMIVWKSFIREMNPKQKNSFLLEYDRLLVWPLIKIRKNQCCEKCYPSEKKLSFGLFSFWSTWFLLLSAKISDFPTIDDQIWFNFRPIYLSPHHHKLTVEDCRSNLFLFWQSRTNCLLLSQDAFVFVFHPVFFFILITTDLYYWCCLKFCVMKNIFLIFTFIFFRT